MAKQTASCLLDERGGQTLPGSSAASATKCIRLDLNPDVLIEEPLGYNPTLIVLDSLTRLDTNDENAAGAMSKLYNDGIKPLALETDVASLSRELIE